MDGSDTHNNGCNRIGIYVATVEHDAVWLDRRTRRDASISRHNSSLRFPSLRLLPISSPFVWPFLVIAPILTPSL
ncbi:hypothetical protein LINGRAHAP2_LOCUS19834 [Linum grandiflorum]